MHNALQPFDLYEGAERAPFGPRRDLWARGFLQEPEPSVSHVRGAQKARHWFPIGA